MLYYEIKIEACENLKETIINLFFENGFIGIREEFNIYNGNIIITSYADIYKENQIENLKASVNALKFFGIYDKIEITISKLNDEEWANSWKQYYKPFKLGNIVIKPSWEEYTPSEDEKVVELDPGVAFGTGQHPTTELCIRAISDYLKPEMTFIDAGCGSGILGLVAGAIGFKKGYAFDIEQSAVDVSIENFRKSNIENITVFQASSPTQIPEKADIIFANIIATVIKAMGADLVEKMNPNGILIASGIIENRYEDIKSMFENLGLKEIEKRTHKGWVCLILSK